MMKTSSSLHGSVPQGNNTTMKPVGTQVFKDDPANILKEKETPKINSEKVSSLFESI